MRQRKTAFLFSCLVAFVCITFIAYPAYGDEAKKIAVGDEMPKITLEGPESAEVQQYLGLKSQDPFTISQISSKLVLIDIVSAF
jgi:hypothetical protein